jgi:predicted Zn-dependent peptidase
VPKITYRQTELKNGLKVVLSKNRNIPMVIFSVSFYTGAKDEPAGKKGLAHLLEHLMFTGVYGENYKTFDEVLNRIGGESNAYTTLDMTSYYISVPSGMLEYAMILDSKRLKNIDFSPENIDIQKKVVLEEKSQIYDNSPYGSVEFESSKRVFNGTPYEIPVIGTEDSIKGITHEDIRGFFERYYNSGNCVITVCGDFDENNIEKLLNDYYSIIPSGRRKRSEPYFITRELSKEKITIYDKVNLPAVFICFRMPGYGTIEYYASKYIAGMLSSGDSSYLRKELIQNKNLCYDIDSSGTGFEKAGIFCIDAYLNKNVSCEETEYEIIRNINRISGGEFSGKDIEKIRNKIELSYHTSLQTNNSVCDNLSFFSLFTESPERINYEIENALRIKREDIIETAVNYINPEKMIILNYLPEVNYA